MPKCSLSRQKMVEPPIKRNYSLPCCSVQSPSLSLIETDSFEEKEECVSEREREREREQVINNIPLWPCVLMYPCSQHQRCSFSGESR
jgi:hypothetical protein